MSEKKFVQLPDGTLVEAQVLSKTEATEIKRAPQVKKALEALTKGNASLAGWLAEKKIEIDRSTIVVVPVWVMNDMIKRYKEYEKDERLLGHRTSATIYRGRREALELIATDEAFLERGREMLKELVVAQRKPQCNHIWMDMTLNEDAADHKIRKMCHRCFEVVVEAVNEAPKA